MSCSRNFSEDKDWLGRGRQGERESVLSSYEMEGDRQSVRDAKSRKGRQRDRERDSACNQLCFLCWNETRKLPLSKHVAAVFATTTATVTAAATTTTRTTKAVAGYICCHICCHWITTNERNQQPAGPILMFSRHIVPHFYMTFPFSTIFTIYHLTFSILQFPFNLIRF